METGSYKVEPILGRYVNVEIGGRRNRIYFEESTLSGDQAIPIICLHTAGSDSSQFRHLLVDQEVAADFKIIAFDMPWHGKSLPPLGYEEEDYRLTTELYLETVNAFMSAIGIRNPVVMGCSMGGRLVIELARRCGESLRAVIGLEASDYQTPWYDTEWLNRPDVHGGEICAALISGLVAPQSPDQFRWETLWGYLSSGPGVFKGDLHFYREDSDFRDRSSEIDTQLCPLYLLTGEYDFSCTPEDTRRTGQNIPGAKVTIMEKLGHFPMSENPELFRSYLLPVLADIATSS
tara:strand:- start:2697 stop:3569 length:873 start_codon:yes stop_codon:yes gene_type:complete